MDIYSEISLFSGGYSTFDLWMYKNHFRFKKCFNITSSTDEHSYLYYIALELLYIYIYIYIYIYTYLHHLLINTVICIV